MKRFGPGRVRRRLAELIAARLTADGMIVRTDPEKLWPAQGYWRTDFRADVYRWEGQIEILRHGQWAVTSVASWDPMTDVVRGFDWEWDQFTLEFHAHNPRRHPVLQRAEARR